MNKDIKSVVVIIIFVLALSLPFSNKAYHIDDTAFIYLADQIAKDSLRPYSFNFEWGSRSGSATKNILDTPLVSYYIALMTLLFGRTEIILHVSFLIFPIIAGISFYFIAKKFIKWPMVATLVMLASPIFLVSSQNLMPDVPMLSLFLLSFLLFLEGVDRKNHKLLLFGSFMAGIAYLTKPNAIFIIPLLIFYCIIRKKSKYIAYQIVPIAFIALFALHNYYFEDTILIKEYIPFLYGAKRKSISVIMAYFFSNLSYMGGALIFTLFLLYPFLIKRHNIISLCASVLVAGFASLILYKASLNFVSGQYSLFQILLFFIFTSSSLFFILLVLTENYSNTKSAMLSAFNPRIKYNADRLFVFAWFIEMFIVNSIISGGAAKYNTLLLPPLLLFYFIIFKKYTNEFRLNPTKLSILILLFTLLIGIMVAYADYEYANIYRDFAEKIQQKYKNSDNSIFFTGSLGFQYYMQEKGYKVLLHNDNTPKKGDIVVRARLPSPRAISKELTQRIRLIEVVPYDGKVPVRTQNPEAHAGFYTYGGGFLPFSLSNAKLENFEIYYVEK